MVAVRGSTGGRIPQIPAGITHHSVDATCRDGGPYICTALCALQWSTLQYVGGSNTVGQDNTETAGQRGMVQDSLTLRRKLPCDIYISASFACFFKTSSHHPSCFRRRAFVCIEQAQCCEADVAKSPSDVQWTAFLSLAPRIRPGAGPCLLEASPAGHAGGLQASACCGQASQG